MVTIYLTGALTATILYLIIFCKKNSEITALGLICGILSCWASWVSAIVFVYILLKK